MEKYDHKDRFLYLANDTKLIRYYPFESLFVMNWIFFFPVKKVNIQAILIHCFYNKKNLKMKLEIKIKR
jgi:hypothetical protein